MEPYVLRSPNGQNSGLYFAGYDSETDSITWTDDPDEALRCSVSDAYGHLAAALDRFCEALVPENTGTATEADRNEFAKIAANDMWQKPGDTMVDLVSMSVREQDDPLYEPDPTPEGTPGYMSVWEWLLRATYRPKQ